MRRQATLYFVIGVLTAVLIMGGGLVALHWLPDTASAQDDGTWQVQDALSVGEVKEFIGSLPSECDVQIWDGDGNYTVFYSCPE